MVRKRKKLTYEVAIPDKDRRFRELIVYISDKCADDASFGATKLNKILWGSDFLFFLRHRRPITGEKYQRLENGPAPVRLKPVRTKMEGKDIVVRRVDYHGLPQQRTVALRNADLSIFSGEEIAIVDEIIEFFRNRSATEVSKMSHGRAWQTRYDGDLIPYEAALLSNEDITAADISRTEEIGRRLKWHASPARRWRLSGTPPRIAWRALAKPPHRRVIAVTNGVRLLSRCSFGRACCTSSVVRPK